LPQDVLPGGRGVLGRERHNEETSSNNVYKRVSSRWEGAATRRASIFVLEELKQKKSFS